MNSLSEVLAFASLSSAVSGNNSFWSTFFTVLLILGIVCFLGWAISAIIKNSQTRATPQNIANQKQTQVVTQEKQFVGTTQGKQGLGSAVQNTKKADSFEDMRNEARELLINANVQTVRLLGDLGPIGNNVFDEKEGVRLALASGARCLVLEVDRLQNSFEPVLLYRNAGGFKQSLNTGDIRKVAENLAGRAFRASNDGTPAAVAQDPLILVVYFASAPSKAETPKEYVRFLAKVAKALQPIQPLLVGQTPQGDFRRQALESQLFYQPYKLYSGRIILLTNANTEAFRSLDYLGMAGEIRPEEDLDLMVHARLYAKESPSSLGITEMPTDTKRPAACITTLTYWLTTPPERLADATSQTKKAWTLAMPPVATDSGLPTKEQLQKLLVTYGVQAVPFYLSAPQDSLDVFVGKGAPFEKQAWVVKPDLIQFVPSPKIPIQQAIPQANAGGGAMRAPQ